MGQDDARCDVSEKCLFCFLRLVSLSRSRKEESFSEERRLRPYTSCPHTLRVYIHVSQMPDNRIPDCTTDVATDTSTDREICVDLCVETDDLCL